MMKTHVYTGDVCVQTHDFTTVREADHSLPSKPALSCISTPPIRLHGVVLS